MNDVPLPPDGDMAAAVDVDKTTAMLEELMGRLSPAELLSVCTFGLGTLIATPTTTDEEVEAFVRNIGVLITSATNHCLNHRKGLN